MAARIRIDELKYYIIYSLLFLTAMNFQAKFFYFVFISSILFFVLQRKFKVTPASFLYLGLGGIMAVYNASEGVLSMLKCFAPFLFILLGYNMLIKKANTSNASSRLKYEEKHGYYILAVVASGSFFHYMLNFIYNFGEFKGRNTYDVWSGGIMAATGQGALACIMVGFAISMIFAPMKKIHRLWGILCIACVLLYNLVLACRTLIVILAVMIVMAYFYMQTTARSARQKTGRAATIIAVAIFGILISSFSLDWFSDSNLYARFGESLESFFSSSGRIDVKFEFIRDMWMYPFGGLYMREKYGYAHDLMLDGYDEYGVALWMMLIPILIIGIKELYVFIKRTDYNQKVKLAYLLVYISILLIFLVEPIFAGMPWLFACYALINGSIARMNVSFYENSIRRKYSGK